MRLGVHLGYWMDTWGDDPLPLIPRAARAGCDVVELSLYSALPEHLGTLRGAAEREGVELTFTTGLQAETDLSSADPQRREAGVRYLDRCVEMVAEAGGRLLSGVLYTPWGDRTGKDLEARRGRAAEGLARVARTAEREGVDLGIEPINRYETDLVTTVATGAELAGAVAHPRVGLLLDVFHANLEEANVADAIEAAGPHLKHVHLAENHRGLPGTGSMTWGSVLDALRAVGYEGRAVVEAFTRTGTPVAGDTATWVDRSAGGGRDLDVDLASSLAWLRERGW